MTAGTIDKRTVLDDGDSATNWNTGSPTTTAFAETPSCIAEGIGEDEGPIYCDTGAQLAVSGQMVYVYSQVVATQDSWTGGVHGLYMIAGTDEVVFHQSGNDREVFKHSEGPVGFQCFLLDMGYADQKDAAGETTEIGGTFANLWTDIQGDNVDGIGAYYVNLSKALGGGVNSYCDIIRYGNDGITIVYGSSADPATFLEVVEIDRDTSAATGNLKAHGIIREYTPGIYGVQGPLNFGDANIASGVWFEDTGAVVVFENRDVLDDKYYFDVEGNSSAYSRFDLNNSTISTAGPYVSMTMASGDLDYLNFDTVVFSGLGNDIRFSNSVDSSGHYVNSCTFTGCGQIDPGLTSFTNNNIANPTSSGTGGLLLDGDGTDNWSDLSFTSEGAGHAIYVSTSGYYSFNNFTYTGYGANETDDAIVFNDSGGTLVLAIGGGDSPTYLNSAGGAVSLVNEVDLTVTVYDEAGDPVENAQVAIYEGAVERMNEDTLGTGIATAKYNYTADVSVNVRVRKGSTTDSPKYTPVDSTQTIRSTGLTVTITLIEDTNNNS